jgi:hypothetical protein
MTTILTIYFITLLLAFIAGGYDSLLDTLVSKPQFDNSKLSNMPNQNWWNWFISGGNKWKNGHDSTNGEKFFGSSTFLSFITDAFHMFKALMIVTIFAIPSLIIICLPEITNELSQIDFSNFQWYYYSTTFIVALIVYASCWGISFEITKKLLKK